MNPENFQNNQNQTPRATIQPLPRDEANRIFAENSSIQNLTTPANPGSADSFTQSFNTFEKNFQDLGAQITETQETPIQPTYSFEAPKQTFEKPAEIFEAQSQTFEKPAEIFEEPKQTFETSEQTFKAANSSPSQFTTEFSPQQNTSQLAIDDSQNQPFEVQIKFVWFERISIFLGFGTLPIMIWLLILIALIVAQIQLQGGGLFSSSSYGSSSASSADPYAVNFFPLIFYYGSLLIPIAGVFLGHKYERATKKISTGKVLSIVSALCVITVSVLSTITLVNQQNRLNEYKKSLEKYKSSSSKYYNN